MNVTEETRLFAVIPLRPSERMTVDELAARCATDAEAVRESIRRLRTSGFGIVEIGGKFWLSDDPRIVGNYAVQMLRSARRLREQAKAMLRELEKEGFGKWRY